MSDEYIFDEKIHILDEKTAYIIKKLRFYGLFPESKSDDIVEQQLNFCKTLAEYILSIDKEMAIRFLSHFIYNAQPLELQFILKPSQDILNPEIATLALKFDRLPDDEEYFHDQ